MSDNSCYNGFHLIDIVPAIGQMPSDERPVILPSHGGAYLLAPAFVSMPPQAQEINLWLLEDIEQFYRQYSHKILSDIVERYYGPITDPHSRSRVGLLGVLYSLHRGARLKVFNLSQALPSEVIMGLHGANIVNGAAMAAPAISFANLAQPLPIPEKLPHPGTIETPKPPLGGGKVIQFPKKIYGPNNNKPPPHLRFTGKGIVSWGIRRLPWLMGIAPSNMGLVTEWQDPTLDDIHYEYIADQIFNFQIYLKNVIIATYSIRWQYNDNQRSEDAIIYDQSGEPIATLGADGTVEEINDLSEAERRRQRLLQQFWQRILYQTYIANGGRKSFDDWLNFGAHATPTPDENVEFLEYTANGGKLSYLDWLAAGKPSNRPVRVVPEGDGYDASKQSELRTKDKEGTIDKGGSGGNVEADNVVPNNLTSRLSGDAAEVIATSTKGQLRRQAALSSASVDELGLVSGNFTNLPGSVKNFAGVQRLGDDFFVINDKTAFINKVDDLFAQSNNPLNPITRSRILDHIGDGSRQFPTQAGIPGLHAEVQSVNSILNQVPRGFDLSKINVSTIKLAPGPGQGLPFPACTNCGGILSNSVNILTGVK